MGGPTAECLRSNTILILDTVLRLPNSPLVSLEIDLLRGFVSLGAPSQVRCARPPPEPA